VFAHRPYEGKPAQGPDIWSFYAGKNELEVRVGGTHYSVARAGSPFDPRLGPGRVGGWLFTLTDAPEDAVRVFLTGSSPELGKWERERAIPLRYYPEGSENPLRTARPMWSVCVPVFTVPGDPPLDPIEYRYLCELHPSGARVVEAGPNRILRYPEVSNVGDDVFVGVETREDEWRSE
jgi:Starch binding domain